MSSESKILVSEQWIVGGFEENPNDSAKWREWRNLQLSIRLEEQARAAMAQCLRYLETHTEPDEHELFHARLLMEEAIVNLCGHGKQGLPTHPSTIQFEIRAHGNDLQNLHHTLRMEDDRPPFSIENLPDPTFDENLCEVTGRGILLIRESCRAKIEQVPTARGGKHMVYEWRRPKYTLTELGLPEKPVGESAKS